MPRYFSVDYRGLAQCYSRLFFTNFEHIRVDKPPGFSTASGVFEILSKMDFQFMNGGYRFRWPLICQPDHRFRQHHARVIEDCRQFENANNGSQRSCRRLRSIPNPASTTSAKWSLPRPLATPYIANDGD